MLVAVRPERGPQAAATFYTVPVQDEDLARRAAFRYDRGRREVDFSDLMNHTLIYRTVDLDAAAIQLTQRMT